MIGNLTLEGGDHCDLNLVLGCTDPSSHLFNPLANVDDGCPIDTDAENYFMRSSLWQLAHWIQLLSIKQEAILHLFKFPLAMYSCKEKVNDLYEFILTVIITA